MKNWFKQIVSKLLPSEKEVYEKTVDTHSPSRMNKQLEKRSSAHPQPQPKMLYQYPQGKFRFPVIPDDTASLSKSEEKKIPKVDPQKTSNVLEKREAKFKMTEVPSPIYGFQTNRGGRAKIERSNKIEEISHPIRSISVQPDAFSTSREDDQQTNFQDVGVSKEITEVEQELIGFKETLQSEALDHVAEDNQQQLTEKEDVGIKFDKTNEVLTRSLQEEQAKDPLLEESKDEKEPLVFSQATKENKDLLIPQSPETEKQEGNENHKQQKKVEPIYDQRGKLVPYNVMMLTKDKKRTEVEPEKKTILSVKPPLQLLNEAKREVDENKEWLDNQASILNATLRNFNVRAKVVHASRGPSVTRFEVQPEPGVKVNKITNLSDDIKLSMAAKDIRIEAPIPGKNAIGIEVPNEKAVPVFIKEIIQHPSFQESKSPLTVSLGLDIGGTPIITDLKKMPHGLIAGATGSGKSVCINSIITSLLYKASPQEVKLLLIDPKMVELAPYNEIPHLISPVITDVKAATAALKWAVNEMERRYELFAHVGVRDIERFNQKAKENEEWDKHLPYVVVVIDELADLMMMSPQEVEEAICRIAQKARACGIHLLVATQRPSVDVITGLIKANIPTRIAFSVSSQIDSRTILDASGAEKLLGKGDMLFLENGVSKPARIQGCFVSDEEIERITDYVKQKMDPEYLFEQEELIENSAYVEEEDDLFEEACLFIFEQDAASASSLQRRFHIGYNRAARLIDMMEARGIISETKGSKPRDVLISKDSFEKNRQNEQLL